MEVPVSEQRSRYQKGDVVVLFPSTSHEGPHPDDVNTPIELARVAQVIRHPNNPDWITEYVIQDPTSDNATGWGDLNEVKPGKIHRLATPEDMQKAKDQAEAEDYLDYLRARPWYDIEEGRYA
jgi:hypothetical protein